MTSPFRVPQSCLHGVPSPCGICDVPPRESAVKRFLFRPFRALADRYVGPVFAFDAIRLAITAMREMEDANVASRPGPEYFQPPF